MNRKPYKRFLRRWFWPLVVVLLYVGAVGLMAQETNVPDLSMLASDVVSFAGISVPLSYDASADYGSPSMMGFGFLGCVAVWVSCMVYAWVWGAVKVPAPGHD